MSPAPRAVVVLVAVIALVSTSPALATPSVGNSVPGDACRVAFSETVCSVWDAAEAEVVEVAREADVVLCEGADRSLLGGCLVWQRAIDRGSSDFVTDVAGHAATGRVFVLGGASGVAGSPSSVVAFDASTGDVLWDAPFLSGFASANALAVHPDGSIVVATGTEPVASSNSRIVTVAYDSGTGAEVWVTRTDVDSLRDVGRTIDVAATGLVSVGAEVQDTFVHFHCFGFFCFPHHHFHRDVLVATYEGASGAALWSRRVFAGLDSHEFPIDVAVTPNGSRVVLAMSTRPSTVFTTDMRLVGYDGASGQVRWSSHVGGPIATGDLEVSPDGEVVYLATVLPSTAGGRDLTTLAHSAADGASLWTARSPYPESFASGGTVAVAPDGETVFTSGSVSFDASTHAFGTFAYRAVDGSSVWTARHDGPAGSEFPRAVTVSDDGTRVYVTGDGVNAPGNWHRDVSTVAYDAGSGVEAWSARANLTHETATGLVVVGSPGSERIVVAGSTGAESATRDWLLLAYEDGVALPTAP